LRKAKTREKRLRAMSFLPSDERLALSLKMGKEESERLFGPARRDKKRTGSDLDQRQLPGRSC